MSEIAVTPDEGRPSKYAWAVLLFVTLLVWAPVVRSDFVGADDQTLVVQNPHFDPPTAAGMAWYWLHPMLRIYMPISTTLWAMLAGLSWHPQFTRYDGHFSPGIFHAAQMLLQTGAAAVVFTILRRVWKDDIAALIGALVFAIHPIQTEAVAYIGVLNHPLCGLLSLLAISQYLVATDPMARTIVRRRAWVLGTIVLICALLAKPFAIVVAPIVVVLDLALYRRGLRKTVLSVLPWGVLCLLSILLTNSIQHVQNPTVPPIWYRFVVAGDALLFYVRKVVWPTNLALDYGRTPLSLALHGITLSRTLLVVVAFAAAIYAVREKPKLVAAILIFILAMLPNAGFIPFDYQQFSTVSDRYLYMSMLGVALMVAGAIHQRRRLIYIAVPLLVGMAVLTERQILCWRNDVTLCRHNLQVNPNSWMMMTNLGVDIADTSPDEAIDLIRRTLQIHEASAPGWNALGVMLEGRGQRSEAVAAFKRANAIEPNVARYEQNLARAESTSQ